MQFSEQVKNIIVMTGLFYNTKINYGKDPGAEDPAVLYWFKTSRNANGGVGFIPHLIDGNSRVSRQISTGDIDKHVYCQVPKLTEAAVKAGVIIQLGTQVASSIGHRLAVQWIKNGAIGKIKHANMQFINHPDDNKYLRRVYRNGWGVGGF